MSRSQAPPLPDETVFHLPGTPEAVRQILGEVTETLSADGVGPPTSAMVELVLAEALNNIVEHAQPGTGKTAITLSLAVDPSALRVGIRDVGDPMPGDCLPETGPHDLDVPRDDLPEGGFGWFLIRSIAESVVYKRRDGANHLEILIRIQP